MKRILIIIAVFLLSTVFTWAQEENEEPTQEEAIEAVAEEVQEEAEKTVETKQESTKSAAGYIADLSSDDEDKIIAAADWLGEKGEKAAVPELINLLKNDKRVKVRIYASITLGLIADESSILALNEALTGDSNADVRYSVLLAIHRIDPSKSLDALKKAKETESDPYMRDYMEKMEEKWKEK